MTSSEKPEDPAACASEYLRGRQILQRLRTEGLSEESAAQDGVEVSGHDCLLLHGAVVLQGQD